MDDRVAAIVEEMNSALERTKDDRKAEDRGLTSRELSILWGVSAPTVRRRLQILESGGLLRHGIRYVTGIDGHDHRAACYWVEAAE